MKVEYHRAVTQYSGCTDVLVCARACDPGCVRYRSGEINYIYGYIIYTNVCLLFFATANKCLLLLFFFFKKNIFLRSVIVLV